MSVEHTDGSAVRPAVRMLDQNLFFARQLSGTTHPADEGAAHSRVHDGEAAQRSAERSPRRLDLPCAAVVEPRPDVLGMADEPGRRAESEEQPEKGVDRV